jgi:hypothetical protein
MIRTVGSFEPTARPARRLARLRTEAEIAATARPAWAISSRSKTPVKTDSAPGQRHPRAVATSPARATAVERRARTRTSAVQETTAMQASVRGGRTSATGVRMYRTNAKPGVPAPTATAAAATVPARPAVIPANAIETARRTSAISKGTAPTSMRQIRPRPPFRAPLGKRTRNAGALPATTTASASRRAAYRPAAIGSARRRRTGGSR